MLSDQTTPERRAQAERLVREASLLIENLQDALRRVEWVRNGTGSKAFHCHFCGGRPIEDGGDDHEEGCDWQRLTLVNAGLDALCAEVQALQQQVGDAHRHSGQCATCGEWSCGFCGVSDEQGQWYCERCCGTGPLAKAEAQVRALDDARARVAALGKQWREKALVSNYNLYQGGWSDADEVRLVTEARIYRKVADQLAAALTLPTPQTPTQE